ncbi:DUF1295-domain-containing protein [Paraphaeosphaeria sporulosa]|uniref:DUF1295-domain-containing protein n=1 Tax=Paraphaeosphaeria sporulosa TaxID=1460663 RepID=A0A177CI33_9PLEO|nr:DUF1295-domain-containing protein [Paraphaeosphaeria sporulosa]OAG06490.1 DUF1295-domain-containing protein [Paraphaeosphaeria sporulosa]
MLDLRPTLRVALPVVKALPECADFSRTVSPFLPQLYDLPQRVFDNINNLEALQHVYLSTNPLITALGFSLFLTPIVFIVAEINKNYSQVDRLWSILPVIYNSHYALWAHLSGLPTQRLDHVMAVTILWGARLTFNYWRKGGYSVGSEDYRWNIVKDYAGPAAMFVLNIVFISLAQNILLFAITTPTYILLLCSRLTGDEFTFYDSIFSKLIFAIVLIEFFADQQQWNFHGAKNAYKATAKVPKEYSYTREQLDRGFNTSGLWAWSRHPNFAAEQGVWLALYQWSCSESETYVNWCFAAALSYLILFQASTWLTELISAKKYPDYKLYQERVGRFLPKIATGGMDAPTANVNAVSQKQQDTRKNVKATGSTRKR